MNNSEDNLRKEEASAPVEAAPTETAPVETADEQSMPVAIIDDSSDDDSVPDEERSYVGSSISRRLAATEDIVERPRYQRGKLTPKNAIETFFYLNKTRLIIGAVIVAFALVALFSFKKVPYDQSVVIYADELYVGTTVLEEFKESLVPFAEDMNGDGKVMLSLNSYDCSSTDATMVMASVLYMSGDINSQHDCYLIFTDDTNYLEIKRDWGEDIFESYKGNPKWMSLSGTELMSSIEDTYGSDPQLGVALLSISEKDAEKKKFLDNYNAGVAMLDNILEAYPEIASESNYTID